MKKALGLVDQERPWYVIPFVSTYLFPTSFQRHMQALVERAEKSLESYRRGHGFNRQPTDPSEPDTLDVLGGRKSLIVPKSNNNSPTSSNDSPNSSSGSRRSHNPPVAAPAPMPPQTGAVEMLNQYYQNEHDKHEVYTYFSPPAQIPSNSQALPQPHYPLQLTSQPNGYSQYPTTSGQEPLSPSAVPLNALSPTEGYPTPSDAVYSPQFEVSSLYPTSPVNSMRNGVGSSHSWLSQPHGSSSAGHHYQPQSPLADGNELGLGYNIPPNGHSQYQQPQSPQHQHQLTAGMDISQGDIWSNFAQDFRP